MASTLQQVQQLMLSQHAIDDACFEKAFQEMRSTHLDFADLYFQLHKSESWGLEDGMVRQASFHRSSGVGVRAIFGDAVGYAYSDVISPDALIDAARSAKSIGKQGKSMRIAARKVASERGLYPSDNPIEGLDHDEKVRWLEQMDQLARSLDPRVCKVDVNLAASHDLVLIVASDGTLAADIRPLVRFNVSVMVEQKGRKEKGSSGGGGRFSYDSLRTDQRDVGFVQEAVRQALVNLDAEDAPAGSMQVVLGPGWPAVLLHEAIGHGLEGDFNRKGTSVFTGKIGQRVATEHCTILDDGTMPDRRGSLQIDDEGHPTQATCLVEKGILRGYMLDKHNAHLMKTQSTGNGRRQSYAFPPLPRMTNTYLQPGDFSPEEIIASLDKGIYATSFSGGSVDITSGKFVFSASEAYRVEKGKIICPVKGVTLIGNGAEVLHKIDMVGNDLQIDQGIGTCGKAGQSVPVGVGQPTLRVSGLTVGGTRVAG